jgi:hypothetical protein
MVTPTTGINDLKDKKENRNRQPLHQRKSKAWCCESLLLSYPQKIAPQFLDVLLGLKAPIPKSRLRPKAISYTMAGYSRAVFFRFVNVLIRAG